MTRKEQLIGKILEIIKPNYPDVYSNSKGIDYQISCYDLTDLSCIRLNYLVEATEVDPFHPQNINKRIELIFEASGKANDLIKISVEGYNNVIEFIIIPKNQMEHMEFSRIKLIEDKSKMMNTKSVKFLSKIRKKAKTAVGEFLEIEKSFHCYDKDQKSYYSIYAVNKENYLVIDKHEDIFQYEHRKPQIIRKSANEIEVIGNAVIKPAGFNLSSISKEEFLKLI